MEDRFKKIVKINGKKFQFEIAIEEASEFIQAVQKYKRGKGTLKHVLEEMADTLVTFSCLVEALQDEELYSTPQDIIAQFMVEKTDWVENYDQKNDKPVTWQNFKSTGS